MGSTIGKIAGGFLGGATGIPGGAAIGSALGGSLFGGGGSSGGSTQQDFSFVPFNAGGISTSFGQGGLSVQTSGERQALINSLAGNFRNQATTIGSQFAPQTQSAFDQQLSELQGLRPLVAPGFSALRENQIQALEDARQRSLGNVRENLAQRRILGSSFAQDAQTRAEIEFARERGGIEARSTLQELELTNNLINQEFQTSLQGVQTALNLFNAESGFNRAGTQTELDEQNRLAGLAQELSTGIQSTLNDIARLNTDRSIEEAKAGGFGLGALGQSIFGSTGGFGGGSFSFPVGSSASSSPGLSGNLSLGGSF